MPPRLILTILPDSSECEGDMGSVRFQHTVKLAVSRMALGILVLLAAMLCTTFMSLFGLMPECPSAGCGTPGLHQLVSIAYADTGKPVVVSMGDSYSSGEGTEPFYYQNRSDKFAKEDFLAHRSEKAWPGQLVVGGRELKSLKGDSWYFTAVSGAETRHILTDCQTVEWQEVAGGNVETTDLPCQFDIFEEKNLKGFVDYVTLTIGGNDVGFGAIVSTACKDDVPFLGTGDLDAELQASLTTFDTKTRRDLRNVYDAVGDAAGAQATIIVAGYPHLFPSNGQGAAVASWLGEWFGKLIHASVDESEAKRINGSVDVFNAGIREVVESTLQGNVVFVDVRPYFNGHEGEYINAPFNYPKDQDLLKQRPNGGEEASHYSVHPNERGQAAYARAVQDKIDELEQQTVSKPAIDVSSDVLMSLVFDISGSMDDASAFGGMTKLASAKQQSTAFVSSVQRQGGIGGMSIKVGVASFATNATTNCGLSNDPNDINDSINSLRADGRTNIYAGLAEGIAQLESDDGERLLVFLSDGLSNEGGSRSDIIELAHQAADEGIKIFTIGFGRSNDLDESLLQEIASITGGEYSHEDSSELMSAAVGLFASMMNASLSASSQVLLSETGTVQQGQTVAVGTFDVSGSGTVQAYLYWPGSILDLKLTDPDGNVVKEGYAGCAIDASSIPTLVTIDNAKPGTWDLAVYGQEVSMSEEPFCAVAAFDETAATAPTSSGGGTSTNNGEGLIFITIVVAIACVVGLFAYTKRRGRNG